MTTSVAERRAPIATTVRLARPSTRGLVLSTALGAGCIASAIALLGTSAWLISRCAQHGSIADLGLAIVSVRFFAVSRGLFRYGERLVGHDGAFRSLAELRVARLRAARAPRPDRAARLPPRRPARSSRPRTSTRCRTSGSACCRRGGSPGVVGLATTVALVAAPSDRRDRRRDRTAASPRPSWSPGSRGVLARQTEAKKAPARGELTASVVDLLEGAPDLVAFGATDAQVQRVIEPRRRAHSSAAASSAGTAGVGAGLTVALRRDGDLGRARARRRCGARRTARGRDARGRRADTPCRVRAGRTASRRRAGARGRTQLCGPARVSDGRSPRRWSSRRSRPRSGSASRHGLRIRGVSARCTRPTVRGRSTRVDLDLESGRRVALVGPSGAGKSTLAAVLARFVEYESGSIQLDGVELRDLSGEQVRNVVGLVEQDAHIFDSTLRENLRLAKPAASDPELLCCTRAGARLDDWVDDAPARPRHSRRRARLVVVGWPASADRGCPCAARRLPDPRPRRTRRASRRARPRTRSSQTFSQRPRAARRC